MDRMFAPWRRAFVEGAQEQEVPSPSGCIFCDFPLAPGASVPGSLQVEAETMEVGERNRAEWDKRRLVVTTRAEAFVILNRYPYNNGHVMVVPRVHSQRLEELEPAIFTGLQALLRETVAAVRTVYEPHGINVGMNMGRAAGAGIDQHIHWHVMPRWSGDVNFMPAIAGTKVISEGLDDTYARLAAVLRRPEDDA